MLRFVTEKGTSKGLDISVAPGANSGKVGQNGPQSATMVWAAVARPRIQAKAKAERRYKRDFDGGSGWFFLGGCNCGCDCDCRASLPAPIVSASRTNMRAMLLTEASLAATDSGCWAFGSVQARGNGGIHRPGNFGGDFEPITSVTSASWYPPLPSHPALGISGLRSAPILAAARASIRACTASLSGLFRTASRKNSVPIKCTSQEPYSHPARFIASKNWNARYSLSGSPFIYAICILCFDVERLLTKLTIWSDVSVRHAAIASILAARSLAAAVLLSTMSVSCLASELARPPNRYSPPQPAAMINVANINTILSDRGIPSLQIKRAINSISTPTTTNMTDNSENQLAVSNAVLSVTSGSGSTWATYYELQWRRRMTLHLAILGGTIAILIAALFRNERK